MKPTLRSALLRSCGNRLPAGTRVSGLLARLLNQLKPPSSPDGWHITWELTKADGTSLRFYESQERLTSSTLLSQWYALSTSPTKCSARFHRVPLSAGAQPFHESCLDWLKDQ